MAISQIILRLTQQNFPACYYLSILEFYNKAKSKETKQNKKRSQTQNPTNQTKNPNNPPPNQKTKNPQTRSSQIQLLFARTYVTFPLSEDVSQHFKKEPWHLILLNFFLTWTILLAETAFSSRNIKSWFAMKTVFWNETWGFLGERLGYICLQTCQKTELSLSWGKNSSFSAAVGLPHCPAIWVIHQQLHCVLWYLTEIWHQGCCQRWQKAPGCKDGLSQLLTAHIQ